MKWSYYENIQDAILKLKKEKYKIISVEQADKSTGLENFKIQSEKNYAIIFGNEINGVNQKVIDMSDDVVEIPQYGTKHSFNVSVCVGIVIWDFFTKIKTN